MRFNLIPELLKINILPHKRRNSMLIDAKHLVARDMRSKPAVGASFGEVLHAFSHKVRLIAFTQDFDYAIATSSINRFVCHSIQQLSLIFSQIVFHSKGNLAFLSLWLDQLEGFIKSNAIFPDKIADGTGTGSRLTVDTVDEHILILLRIFVDLSVDSIEMITNREQSVSPHVEFYNLDGRILQLVLFFTTVYNKSDSQLLKESLQLNPNIHPYLVLSSKKGSHIDAITNQRGDTHKKSRSKMIMNSLKQRKVLSVDFHLFISYTIIF